MGTDNMTLGPGILYDGLGKPIGTCVKEDEVDTVFPEGTDNYGHPVTLSKAFEAELDGKINASVLNELAGLVEQPNGFWMTFDGFRYEQIRKHKKKRINKKWAKRYGYRAVPCKYMFKNCHMSYGMFNDFAVTSDSVTMEDIKQ